MKQSPKSSGKRPKHCTPITSVYQITAQARNHGVTHQAVRDELFALVERGLLTVSKVGRSYAFRASESLNEELAKTD